MSDFHTWAQKQPEKAVLIQAESGASLTARELDADAQRMARWFLAKGLADGASVALVVENRNELIALALGAELAGLYFTPISTHLTAAEVAYIVQDCSAQLVIATAKTAPMLSEVPAGLPRYSLDGRLPDAPELVDLPAELATVDVGTALPPRSRGRDLLYSSGTTGRPKGVKRPLVPFEKKHELEPAALNAQQTYGLDEHTVYLSPAPLYHAAPLRFCLRVLGFGGTVVIMPRFDPETALALIERHRVTHSQWVPTMFTRMLALPEATRARYRTDSLRVAIHAAAPCPVPLKQAMLAWWGDILIEYYGGSEGVGITTITAPEWHERPGSVGRATLGVIHIVGDDGQELPPGEIGRIYFSGGPTFSYLNDEAKTREAYNDRGWATYGDIGHVDEAGYLFLSDRRADLILAGGVNIYPQEIENALSTHPAVADVAVVGVPDADFGEVPLAIVTLRPGQAADEAQAQALLAHAADKLARLKWPHRVVFETELPRLETGKLLRRVLKERYREQANAGFLVRKSKA
ncbi:acyl-CoA synthetase [Comamonas serinivorans]|uniref:Acyl-CoA synthetase n=1 Tax=Comamonas serinivorans TaxID=1082851 RepID=A0A1Y0EML0_9BURK|nr:AMP-binding protein [Comamonas serinivorans]ARU04836.1 acyl-CoA synthetase [Comamonas serinivorans]